MEQPILNPQNPYVGTLRVFPGTLVKVAGRPRPNATRFAINFQTGPSLNPRDDLALHLSPCFTPSRIVRNSLIQGSWGVEEAWSNGAILSPHAPFEIMILVEPEQFKIAINGSHYCDFRHRIPYQQITHLSIDGDLDIERISVASDVYGHQQQQQQQHQPTPSYQPPTVAPAPGSYGGGAAMPPYPPAGGPMPTPAMYPNLGPSNLGPSPYPSVPLPSMPAGPAPTPNSYASGYPAPGPYPPQQPVGPYPPPNTYPQPMPPTGGPAPAPNSYGQGYPQQQPHHQARPGHSSSHTSTPFGNIPIGGKALGTIAGLGLGAAAGAAALSVLNPVKTVKKMMKPKKMFKHKGWGRQSSSSSNSSRSSISSRSSCSSNSS